jgi:hypothetical protein
MSYTFRADAIYRMPTHFGPAPGPRQPPVGIEYDNDTAPRTLVAWMRWPVASDLVERLLPPGFAPVSSGSVTVEIRRRRALPWLAGRGYNILMASVDVLPPDGLPAGRLQMAVWESLADAVMSGREELGVPKLWASITDLGDPRPPTPLRMSADWLGYRFFNATIERLTEDEPSARHDIAGPNYYQWRYFPRPGARGGAEASYPTMTPGSVAHRVTRSWRGQAHLAFEQPTWHDMPTQHHVVCGLRALMPPCPVEAGVAEIIGSRDLSDQRPLRTGEATDLAIALKAAR